MNICIICPVRNGTPQSITEYVAKLESQGNKVHFPPRDNPQDDPTGYIICNTMRQAVIDADEIHAIYSFESMGTHFDLGMAFALNKQVKIINPEIDVPGKSYIKVFQWS